MNTNALFAIVISISTNWTGYHFEGKELGHVVTNHTAIVVHEGATNTMQLKTDRSNIAAWRTPLQNTIYLKVPEYTWRTNAGGWMIPPPIPGIAVTNVWVN